MLNKLDRMIQATCLIGISDHVKNEPSSHFTFVKSALTGSYMGCRQLMPETNTIHDVRGSQA